MSIVDWRDEGHERLSNEPPDTSSSSSSKDYSSDPHIFYWISGCNFVPLFPRQSKIVIKFYYILYISECVQEFVERIINIGYLWYSILQVGLSNWIIIVV